VRHENELTNGHTHFILTGSEDVSYDWGDETQVKFDIAKRIAQGRASYGGSKYACKIVTVVLGDNSFCMSDIEMVSVFIPESASRTAHHRA